MLRDLLVMSFFIQDICLLLSKLFCVFYLYIYIIYDWITIMGYSKHELGTINMMYPPKEIVLCHPFLPITATSPQKATFFRPQGGRCREGFDYIIRVLYTDDFVIQRLVIYGGSILLTFCTFQIICR